MKKHERSGQEWKAICILLAAAVLFLAWGWHSAERKRADVLDELDAKNAEIEEMRLEINDLREMLENDPG
jgi:cell division protein FtsL